MESSAWVDENEMFSVAQQPSLHYRTPLGLGYRDNTGYRNNTGYFENTQRPQHVNVVYDDVPMTRPVSKLDSPLRKCKCAFKRLSKIFRKD